MCNKCNLNGCSSNGCGGCNQCDQCNTCDDKEYIVSINRDDIDSSVIRSISNLGNITDWHDGQIRSVTIQNGRILVDVVNSPNVVIDGEDLDFKYLKSITKNDNGSFDIVDSDGLTNRIPAGFPTRVEYNSDNSFTLATDDGQEITVDVLDVLGSYVKCVSTNCDGDIVFEIETNNSCGACSNEEVVLPLNDLGVETDPVYNSEKNTLARNSTESDGTITLNNGDGTTITTYTDDEIDSLIDSVDVEETDPIYNSEKVQLARNSTETSGVITLNNGDGTTITTYNSITIDGLVDGGGIDEEVDPIYNSEKHMLERNHVEDIGSGTITLTTGTGDTSVVYNKGSVDNSLNEILAKFESVVINATNPGPVNMTGSFVKVLELDPIITSGKYRGAMRATYDGTGLREVTVSIFVNGSPIGRTDVRNVSDTQTIVYQTVEPLELVEDDVVSVYVKIPSGTVVDVDGVLELIISTGTTIDFTGLEKDHSESSDIVTLTNSLDEVSTVYTTDGVDNLISDRLTVEEADGKYVGAIEVNNLYVDSDFQTYTEFAQVVHKIKTDHQDGYQLTRMGGKCSISEFSTLHSLISSMVVKVFGSATVSSAPISWYLDETFESVDGGAVLLVMFDNDSSLYNIQYNNWETDYTTNDLSAFRATKGYYGEIISSNLYTKENSDHRFPGMVYVPEEYSSADFSGMTMAQIFTQIRNDYTLNYIGSSCVTGIFSSTLFPNITSAVIDLINTMYGESFTALSGSFTITSPNPGGFQGGHKMLVVVNGGDTYSFDIDNYGPDYENVDADMFTPSVIHVGTLYEQSPVALMSNNLQLLEIQRDSEVISLERDKMELSETKVQVRYNELSKLISDREALILKIDKMLISEQHKININNRGNMCVNCKCTCECDNQCSSCNNCNSCSDCNTCNQSDSIDEYIVSITVDPSDSKLIHALSSTGTITDWYSNTVRSVSVVGGEIIVDVIDGVNTVISGDELDFEYLKKIVKNEDKSISVIDSVGVTTVIPAGFPTGVIYNGDGSFTLTTQDGQSLRVDTLDAIGSYVKCVYKDCNGDYVFEIISDGSCNSCSDKDVVLPMSDYSKNFVESDGVITLKNGDGTMVSVYSAEKVNDLLNEVVSMITSGGS